MRLLKNSAVAIFVAILSISIVAYMFPKPAFATAGPQILIGGAPNGIGNSTYSIDGAGQTTNSGTETNAFPVSGTLSSLTVYVTAQPGGITTRTFTVKKNGVNQTLLCTVASASNTCTDSSHTVAVAIGDEVEVSVTASGVPAGAGASWSLTFTPTVAGDTVFLGAIQNNGSGTAYFYLPFGTGVPNIIASANTQWSMVMPEAGTLDQLQATTSSARAITSGSWTYSVMQNNATSSLACIMNASSRTTCGDTVDSVGLAIGDTIQLSAASSSASAVSFVGFGARFLPTTTGDFDFLANSGLASDVAGATSYLPVSGSVSNILATEASSSMPTTAAMAITSMTLLRSVAPGSAKTATITLRVNSADSALTCSLTGTGSGGGITTKTCTGSVTVNAGDLLDVSDTLTSAGTAGTIKVGLVANDNTVTPASGGPARFNVIQGQFILRAGQLIIN